MVNQPESLTYALMAVFSSKLVCEPASMLQVRQVQRGPTKAMLVVQHAVLVAIWHMFMRRALYPIGKQERAAALDQVLYGFLKLSACRWHCRCPQVEVSGGG